MTSNDLVPLLMRAATFGDSCRPVGGSRSTFQTANPYSGQSGAGRRSRFRGMQVNDFARSIVKGDAAVTTKTISICSPVPSVAISTTRTTPLPAHSG